MNSDHTILILIILNIFSLILGFILGKILSNSGVSIHENKTAKSFFAEKSPKQKVSIDDTKYVTTIKTDGLEKKYQKLGEIKKSDENIQTSINKLKNMKG